MMKWEYLHAETTAHLAASVLNKRGRDGWELVSAHQYNDICGVRTERLIFKRPIDDPRSKEAASRGGYFVPVPMVNEIIEPKEHP